MTPDVWITLDGASFMVIVWLALWQLADRKTPLRRPGVIVITIALAVRLAVQVHLDDALWSAVLGAGLVTFWDSRHQWWPKPVDREHSSQS
jgi:glucose-6-phosphate-specific signal transduction histidine kinase